MHKQNPIMVTESYFLDEKTNLKIEWKNSVEIIFSIEFGWDGGGNIIKHKYKHKHMSS